MKNRGKKMPRTSIQDILIDEVKELRKDAQTNLHNSQITREMLVEIATTLRDVKEQTTRTNGRVTKAEARLNFQRGGIYVAYIGIGLIIALLTLLK